MDKINKRLIVDLRKDCDFAQNHIPSRFKFAIVVYYIILSILILGATFAIANIAIAKNSIKAAEIEQNCSISNMCTLQDDAKKIDLQIQKANKLIAWLLDSINGQKLLYSLFSELSNEVVLERFSFKYDQRNPQIILSINLKGRPRELHLEFDNIISKLKMVNLQPVTLNQSEISGGMHLKCICQMNLSSIYNREQLL
ncbi:MAG: hypothetical protein C5B43_01705 [Verrucomicrobia bacterium]|nr:MAG: hypothetical protein C5B43_01705 [Verrucomicrobiota bacterium]